MAPSIFPPTTPFLSSWRWREAPSLILPALHRVRFNKTTQLTTPSPPPAPAGSGATPSPPPGFAHPGARSSYSLPSRHPCLCPRQSHSSTRVRPRSNLGLCGPAWALPLPLPSLPKGQEGQDGARRVSRVNRLGAAGVWSSRDGTHRNVHSQ